MAEPAQPTRRWLIAAWPGMGNVAVIAASHLLRALRMRPVDQLPPRGHFDVNTVDVQNGVIVPPRLPRGAFFRPVDGRGTGAVDLTVFLAEAQPTTGAWAYAHELLEYAGRFAVQRVVTFASMASQLHPSKDPKVGAAFTGADLLDEARRLEVRPLEEGQLGGLNGVLLGAAVERNLSGICLLGEIPYFAAAVPNPKAARAVLDAFCLLAGIEIDLSPLDRDAATVDQALLKMLERLEEQGAPGFAEGEFDIEPPLEESETEPPAPQDPVLDLASRDRIERLFETARRDRSRAVELKRELDRMGVFERYEDRFLDLFRRAE